LIYPHDEFLINVAARHASLFPLRKTAQVVDFGTVGKAA
jgi:hypothetical protein